MSGFNFGGSNTPKQSLFGAGSTSGGSTPNLFAATNNATSTSSSTPGANSLFGGGATGGSNLFGGGSSSTTPASSKPNLFGANQATAGAPQPASSLNFTFGKQAAPPATGADNSSSPKPTFGANFGGATPSSGNAFNFGNQSSASTPSSKPGFLLSSTTPAGPPPGTSLFGNQPKQPDAGSQQAGSSLFGQKPTTTSTSPAPNLFGGTTSSSTPPGPPGGAAASGFTGFGFGNKDASSTPDANKNTPAQQPSGAPAPNLFSGASASGTHGMQPTQATPKASLFNLGSTTPTSTPASKPSAFTLGTTPAPARPASNQPAIISAPTSGTPLSFGGNQATPASTGAPPSNLFQNLGSATGANTSGFGFGKPAASAPTSTPASTQATSGAATSTANATTGASTPSLFPSLGGTSSAASSAPASTSTSAPPLFSLGNKPLASSPQPSMATTAPGAASTSTGATAPIGAAAAPTGGDAAKGGLAASTAGPAPSAQSRLKNKSMDEIITRWVADLSKYKKEFQSSAQQIAEWDKALVENTDKVKDLFSRTFQAERDAAEVERQLRNMEDNQQELDSFLDRYEKQVEILMKTHGVGGQGRPDGLRGPDQERERTYKLAEKLQDRLNELNKDLTEMIEEINNTSQMLSKTGKPDDPLTKIVRVLNSQLSQLQLIDSGASQLQEKITMAQRQGQRVGANGWNGLGTDPADDFYRSYRGGRTG